MEKAIIDHVVFNQMVNHLSPVVKRDVSVPLNSRYVVSHIHIRVEDGKMTCRACDGFRIHEDIFPVMGMTAPFSCSINVPRLKAGSDVSLILDDRMAYVEFDDVRFATRQDPSESLDLDGMIAKGTGTELHEYMLNPTYLSQAAASLTKDKMHPVILQTGVSHGFDFVILRSEKRDIKQNRYILPLRWIGKR